MQPQPDPDPPPAGESHDGDEARAGLAGRLGRGRERPSALELDTALHAYRRNTHEARARDVLLLLLYRSVAVQARVLIARQFGNLAHREDELVLRALARIEGQDPGKAENEGGPARPALLLADYDFRPVRRTIYSYVLQKTSNIARNMQTEAYVPDGGFWSNDLKTRFGAAGPQRKDGLNRLRGGVQIEVPLGSPADDDAAEAHAAAVPAALRVSETPMRHSVLRVNSLARKLDALAQDMVGKTIAALDGDQFAHGPLRLTLNHRRIWRAWLGLSHPDLIDLSEEELAQALGLSKATVTRDTSAAYAYMLQHAELRALLVCMEPNRFQSGAAQAGQLDLKLDALEGVLRGRNGKRFFRKCVHQWLGEYA